MFIDRKDGGQKLAQALEKYKDENVIVLGIPRGGAETAYYVAKHLNSEFSLLVSRKLGHPDNPEYAFGAIAEDGSTYLNPEATYQLTPNEMDRVIEEQKREIQRRIQKLRKGEALPELKGKTVILVDDGIATGATLFASITMCKNKGAGKIIVAAPVSGREIEQEIKQKVDEVIILEQPRFYHAVSQGYESFFNLSDDAALGFMKKWEQEKKLIKEKVH
ncbi:MAG: phosphoribosyltransferase [Bacteroidetes bacterium RIFCSPLOWO2_12_FULL_35_15]|nr:MAG: phosphoribosyltransferase [Bacteroidetes bacterium RIFCSPLOWO2_12_FULL_35_15]